MAKKYSAWAFTYQWKNKILDRAGDLVDCDWHDNGFKDEIKGQIENPKCPITYAVMGREVAPTTGQVHWQGYIQLKEEMSMAKVKKYFRWSLHLGFARGSDEENYKYCTKEGKFVEYGVRMAHEGYGQGKRSDLDELKKDIRSGKDDLYLMDKHEAAWKYGKAMDRYKTLLALKAQKEQGYKKKEVELFVGGTGCGKTRKAVEENPDYFILNQSPTGCWWDGYNGESCVIIDEFRGWMPYAQLLRITDGYPTTVPVKGGTIPLMAKKIVITSNVEPESWYKVDAQMETLEPLYRRITRKITEWPKNN